MPSLLMLLLLMLSLQGTAMAANVHALCSLGCADRVLVTFTFDLYLSSAPNHCLLSVISIDLLHTMAISFLPGCDTDSSLLTKLLRALLTGHLWVRSWW